jgi:hypothetical protein
MATIITITTTVLRLLQVGQVAPLVLGLLLELPAAAVQQMPHGLAAGLAQSGKKAQLGSTVQVKVLGLVAVAALQAQLLQAVELLVVAKAAPVVLKEGRGLQAQLVTAVGLLVVAKAAPLVLMEGRGLQVQLGTALELLVVAKAAPLVLMERPGLQVQLGTALELLVVAKAVPLVLLERPGLQAVAPVQQIMQRRQEAVLQPLQMAK